MQRDIDLENLRDGMKRRDFEKIQKVFNECEWLDKLGTTDESDTEDDGSLTSRRKDDLDNKIKKDVVQAKKIKRIEKLKKGNLFFLNKIKIFITNMTFYNKSICVL